MIIDESICSPVNSLIKSSIYETFSIYQIDAEDYYIKTEFKNNEFSEFIEKIKSRSITNFDTIIKENNNILTLSTCNIDGKKRVVLHARLLKTQEDEM